MSGLRPTTNEADLIITFKNPNNPTVYVRNCHNYFGNIYQSKSQPFRADLA